LKDNFSQNIKTVNWFDIYLTFCRKKVAENKHDETFLYRSNEEMSKIQQNLTISSRYYPMGSKKNLSRYCKMKDYHSIKRYHIFYMQMSFKLCNSTQKLIEVILSGVS